MFLYFPGNFNSLTSLYSRRLVLLCSLLRCLFLLVRPQLFLQPKLVPHIEHSSLGNHGNQTPKFFCCVCVCVCANRLPVGRFDYFWRSTSHNRPKIIEKMSSLDLYSLIIYGSHKQTETHAATLFYYI